jgi:hypothetical protein
VSEGCHRPAVPSRRTAWDGTFASGFSARVTRRRPSSMYESAASLSVSTRITTTGLVFDPHPVDLPDFTGASEPRALLQVRSVRTFRPLQALVAVLACMCAANQVAPRLGRAREF